MAAKKRKNPDRPALLLASPEGEVFEHPVMEMALDNGLDLLRPSRKDLTPISPGWDLMALPDTRPVGFDPTRGEFVTLREFEGVNEAGVAVRFEPRAVAVHPPPGFVRTHHAAAEYLDTTHPDQKLDQRGAGRLRLFEDKSAPKEACPPPGGDDGARPGLPLWAYTAVGSTRRGLVAATFQADETSRWAPEQYYQEDLPEKIAQRLEQSPDNRVLGQLAQCASEYRCCCAQNVFYERWEGAVPIAPACTAACLGCLSKSPAWDTPSPQDRLQYTPTAEEIAEVMTHHLQSAPEPMVSFGQGCEGEPTMYGDILVESVRQTREKTSRGIININCNGSRPQVVRDAAAAGANALRLSINTFDPAVYALYYRPGDYTLDTVLESLQAGRDAGLYVSINFLIWPGWTDRVEELERVSELVDEGLIQMIQLRNLCVDPGHFRSVLPPREERGILLGMKPFVQELHRRHPKLRFGTFNPRLAADWWTDLPPLPTSSPAPAAAG